MKKALIGFLVFWVGFNLMYNKANANDYNKAVIGHVITNADKIDHGKLMNAEMSKLAHQFTIQMVSIMQQHLPAVLDGAMADMRLKLDSEYKCALLDDTKIADKECQ